MPNLSVSADSETADATDPQPVRARVAALGAHAWGILEVAQSDGLGNLLGMVQPYTELFRVGGGSGTSGSLRT